MQHLPRRAHLPANLLTSWNSALPILWWRGISPHRLLLSRHSLPHRLPPQENIPLSHGKCPPSCGFLRKLPADTARLPLPLLGLLSQLAEIFITPLIYKAQIDGWHSRVLLCYFFAPKFPRFNYPYFPLIPLVPSYLRKFFTHISFVTNIFPSVRSWEVVEDSRYVMLTEPQLPQFSFIVVFNIRIKLFSTSFAISQFFFQVLAIALLARVFLLFVICFFA